MKTQLHFNANIKKTITIDINLETFVGKTFMISRFFAIKIHPEKTQEIIFFRKWWYYFQKILFKFATLRGETFARDK